MPCKHPGCAKLIPYGQQYCEEHQSLHRNDRASACEHGYGAKWQRERKKFFDDGVGRSKSLEALGFKTGAPLACKIAK